MKFRMNRWFGFVAVGCCAAGLSGCARDSAAINRAVRDETEAHTVAVARAENARAEAPPARGEPFRFPADRGGQLLGQLLTPPARWDADAAAPLTKRELPAAPGVGRPELPLADNQAGLPRPPLAVKAPPVRPHAPPEATPFTGYAAVPVAPSAHFFAAGAPIRLASPDVNTPPPLPALGHATADRVPLEDPTTDDSLRAALSARTPARAEPAPFARYNLPDPFENAQAIRLKTLPPEESHPSSSTPRPPQP